jgi:hypothetical protein
MFVWLKYTLLVVYQRFVRQAVNGEGCDAFFDPKDESTLQLLQKLYLHGCAAGIGESSLSSVGILRFKVFFAIFLQTMTKQSLGI